MDIIYRERGTGKTKELLRMSAENKIPILCATDSDRKALIRRSVEYGEHIPMPYSLSDIKEGTLTDNCEVYIDDIEGVMRNILGVNVKCATISK